MTLEEEVLNFIKENNGKLNIWDIWYNFKEVQANVSDIIVDLEYSKRVKLDIGEDGRYKYFIN